MKRAALIDQIQQARDTLERQTCETAGKSGKQIERCVIATFQVAESQAPGASFANGRNCCESVDNCFGDTLGFALVTLGFFRCNFWKPAPPTLNSSLRVSSVSQSPEMGAMA